MRIRFVCILFLLSCLAWAEDFVLHPPGGEFTVTFPAKYRKCDDGWEARDRQTKSYYQLRVYPQNNFIDLEKARRAPPRAQTQMRNVRSGAADGLEYVIRGEDFLAVERFYVVGPKLFRLDYMGQPGTEKDALRFLDSFQFTGKP